MAKIGRNREVFVRWKKEKVQYLSTIKFIIFSMISRHLYLFVIGVTFSSSVAQTTIEPVDLGIQNIVQEQSNWCWAAVAQQTIYWLTGRAPYQCELVADAFLLNRWTCCMYPSWCNSVGYMQQIQSLIYAHGGRYSSIAPPANPATIYKTLNERKAIILFLQTTPYSGHFVVLRGMAWVGGYPVLYLNDPLEYYTKPVTFNTLLRIWRFAIVVYS